MLLLVPMTLFSRSNHGRSIQVDLHVHVTPCMITPVPLPPHVSACTCCLRQIIEEAPAPGLPGEFHAMIGEAAVRAAHAAGYVNAGESA
jgi:hypothetical protein